MAIRKQVLPPERCGDRQLKALRELTKIVTRFLRPATTAEQHQWPASAGNVVSKLLERRRSGVGVDVPVGVAECDMGPGPIREHVVPADRSRPDRVFPSKPCSKPGSRALESVRHR